MTTRTGGKVEAVARTGSDRSGSVRYPPTPEHPEGELVIYSQLDAETYADLRAALADDLTVEITADEALPNKPISAIVLRK